MINNMDTEVNLGTIIRSSTLDNSLTAKSQEMVDLSSRVVTMRENLQMANSMEQESITLQILANSTKENSKTTTWKVKEF